MNTSGEAADQVVRMSLEVGEAALKISGTGAKHLAVMLYAVLKEKKNGQKAGQELATLVKSGRPLDGAVSCLLLVQLRIAKVKPLPCIKVRST